MKRRRCVRIEAVTGAGKVYGGFARDSSGWWVPFGEQLLCTTMKEAMEILRHAGYLSIRKVYEDAQREEKP